MKVGNKVGQNLHNVDATKTNKPSERGPLNSDSLVSTRKGLGDTAKVNLSNQAQAMQRAKEIAGRESVDEAKIARLQKLIDEGKYAVDADAVADRLVDEHLLMGE